MIIVITLHILLSSYAVVFNGRHHTMKSNHCIFIKESVTVNVISGHLVVCVCVILVILGVRRHAGFHVPLC